MTRRSGSTWFAGALAVFATLGGVSCTKVTAPGGPPAPSSAPTADDARTFLTGANATLLKLSVAASQAGWVAQNFITDDTEALDARATQAIADAVGEVRQGGGALRQGRRCRPTCGVSWIC